MTDLEKLTQQIISRWGNAGEWRDGDATNLARLLSANGITDLGQITGTSGRTDVETFGGTNETGSNTWTRPVERMWANVGDRRVGYLGDINNDGSVSKVGERDTFLNEYGDDKTFGGQTIGWSAQGDGNTRYVLRPDGSVVPVWGSSSDADSFRKAALAVSAPIAAWSMGLGTVGGLAGDAAAGAGGAAGGAGGVSAADIGLMADLGGTTLSPGAWSAAFPELAAGGASAADIGLMADLGGKTLTPWDWVSGALANGNLGMAAAAGSTALGFAPGTTFGFGGTAAGTAASSAAGGAGTAAGTAAGATGVRGVIDTIGRAVATIGAIDELTDDDTVTSSRQTDPRLMRALFGDDPNTTGGLLGDLQRTYNSMPASGQNQTMIDAQNGMRGLLNNPAVMNGLLGASTTGQTMITDPMRFNPFNPLNPNNPYRRG